MLISEYIKELEDLKKVHGDLKMVREVMCESSLNWHWMLASSPRLVDTKGKVAICGDGALDQLSVHI
jgi:hypothetical protein